MRTTTLSELGKRSTHVAMDDGWFASVQVLQPPCDIKHEGKKSLEGWTGDIANVIE